MGLIYFSINSFFDDVNKRANEPETILNIPRTFASFFSCFASVSFHMYRRLQQTQKKQIKNYSLLCNASCHKHTFSYLFTQIQDAEVGKQQN